MFDLGSISQNQLDLIEKSQQNTAREKSGSVQPVNLQNLKIKSKLEKSDPK